MSEIDLKPFCGGEESHTMLMQPWSRGDRTFATNGHVAVRVPSRVGIADNPSCPDVAGIFEANKPSGEWLSLAGLVIPDKLLAPCAACDGRGFEHECPDCACPCDACLGFGKDVYSVSVGIGSAIIAARFLTLVAKLPSAEIDAKARSCAPAAIRFDGGEGLISALTKAEKKHIEWPQP